MKLNKTEIEAKLLRKVKRKINKFHKLFDFYSNLEVGDYVQDRNAKDNYYGIVITIDKVLEDKNPMITATIEWRRIKPINVVMGRTKVYLDYEDILSLEHTNWEFYPKERVSEAFKALYV